MIKIKKAIHLDCLRLIDSFANNNKPNFDSFCSEWKTMHFQHIFTGQMNEIDLVHTTFEAFLICKRIIVKESSVLKRIGAIYLLYSLYYKQPAYLYVKIEVNLETWITLRNFIESLKNESSCIQVRYIFWKLVSENAFRYVESDIYYGLELFLNKEKDYSDYTIKNSTANSLFQNELSSLLNEEEGFLKSFEFLEQSYNNLKTKLNKNNKDINLHTAIDKTNIFRDIKSKISSINEILHTNSSAENKTNDKLVDEDENNIFVEENIEIRRRKLKCRARKIVDSQGGSSTSKRAISSTDNNFDQDITTVNNSNSDDNDSCCNEETDEIIINEESNVNKLLQDPLLPFPKRQSKLSLLANMLVAPLPEDMRNELGDEIY